MRLSLTDPIALATHLSAQATKTDDQYQVRLEQLIEHFIDDPKNADRSADAKHLRQTTAGVTLELAAMHAGWVLGFEFCRDLLTRDPADLSCDEHAASKGGAR